MVDMAMGKDAPHRFQPVLPDESGQLFLFRIIITGRIDHQAFECLVKKQV
jgi:hypothetical protein